MNRIVSLRPSLTRGIALLAALFLLTLSLTMFAPQDADALPACGTHIKYYSNSTYSVQVGYRYYDCNGVLKSSSGYVTIYKRVNTYCCEPK
jgi:hypothetical protein